MELEEHNFRIDSEWWEEKVYKWIEYKVNPGWDIIEFLDWKYESEQLFTYEAMLRETKKAGKRVPTYEEFREIVKNGTDIPNLTLTGFISNDDFSFYYLGGYAYFWSYSSRNTSYPGVFLNSSNVLHFSSWENNYGFSVRCLKD